MAAGLPATPQEQEELLAAVGVDSFEALFEQVPQALRLSGPLSLPEPVSELELADLGRQLAARNRSVWDKRCFLGAGAYDHFIPAALGQLISRQEFYTAYTPYQPEISQGTLQAMFEYQTMICELTGMDVANASVYDGASACSEACLLAAQATRRQKILIADTLHPDTEAVLATTARFSGLDLVRIGHEPGRGSVSMADLQNELDDQTAALLVQYPNFFGILDDLPALAEAVHAHHALLVVSTDPIALGLLQPPGEAGADLVVGDGQALGLPLSFGGPSLGFFAARKALMRRIPGRVVGQTRDARGARRYVLTLQTREQHIRREKATSNICTNQGLNALAATIYLALMGPDGLAQAAEQSTRQAHALYQRLLEIPGFSPVFDGPFFKEFTVRFAGDLTALNQALDRDGFIGGLALESVRTDLAGLWLVAVTEKRTDADLDGLIASIQAFVAQGGLGS